MAKKKQLFLHIGIHKTGTTTIQKFMFANKAWFEGKGILYPHAQHHHSLINRSESHWELFLNEINQKKPSKVVISSEAFCTLKTTAEIGEWANLFSDFDVKIVVYLRRQDQRIESGFSQTLKFGKFTQTINEYITVTNEYLKYDVLLGKWAECFGKENMIVRVLERNQIPDVVKDFTQIIGVDTIDGCEIINDANVKPSLEQLKAMAYISSVATKVIKKQKKDGRLIFGKLLIRLLKKFLEENSQLGKIYKYQLLPYETAMEVMAQYEESNKNTAINFLGREDGVLFYEPLTPYQHSELSFTEFTIEERNFINRWLIEKTLSSFDPTQEPEDDDNDE